MSTNQKQPGVGGINDASGRGREPQQQPKVNQEIDHDSKRPQQQTQRESKKDI